MGNRDRFRERLAAGPLLADGAMGTLLFSRGIPQRAVLDELVATRPELIGAIHREYLAAGADIIETSTFGANRIRLAPYGLGDQAGRFARRGAQIAREARDVSGRDVLVAGSIGPLGAPSREILHLDERAIRSCFRETVDGLLEGGADLFWFETFALIDHLAIAVEEARAAAADLPIVALLTFGEDLALADGTAPGSPRRRRWPASPISMSSGVNCGAGPVGCLDALGAMGAAGRAILPNAGLPQRVEGQFVYAAGPDYFGRMVGDMLDAGAAIVGGCCGTTPEHIAAMRSAIDARAGDVVGRRGRARRADGDLVDPCRGRRDDGRAAAARPVSPAPSRRVATSSPSRSTRRARSASSARSRPPGSSRRPVSMSSTSATRRWPGSGWARSPWRSGSSTTSTSNASSTSPRATATSWRSSPSCSARTPWASATSWP